MTFGTWLKVCATYSPAAEMRVPWTAKASMPEPVREFKVVCRGSMLSRAQGELFISRLQHYDRQSRFTIVVKDTAGDLDQQKLLQDMDGKDFFTKDIQDYVISGQADFAVHSLKDVSSELFFKDNHYAV